MKESTKKLLASGLVDQHMKALLVRWGTLSSDDVEYEVKQLGHTREQLEAFAEELEDLLDQERGITRETPLDLPLSEGVRFHKLGSTLRFTAVRDKLARLLVQPEVELIRGDRLRELGHREGLLETGPIYEVGDIDKLYKGEQVMNLLVTVAVICPDKE